VRVLESALGEVKLLEPAIFEDPRGFFMETWNARTFSSLGIDGEFVQDNHSRSAKGVLRGLHYQIRDAQGKLVRVVSGAVFDVAVDMRASSPTFGRWAGFELSAENRHQLWIPPGFAHGFLSLREGTELLYKCTNFYSVEAERCVVWNDPKIGITWPIDRAGAAVLSPKDMAGRAFADAEKFP